MNQAFSNYLRQTESAHRLGNDTEHTHRPALKALLENLNDEITATNEPKRIACGAPDLVITRNNDGLIIGHVEAKDVGVSLDEAAKSEQIKKRYLPALPNFILTDYLEFRWFVDGSLRDHFRIAKVHANGSLIVDDAACGKAERLLKEFLSRALIRIESADELGKCLDLGAG
ncbi:MAG: DNA methyltransferase, partial [Verrucomicrobiota bacterium]